MNIQPTNQLTNQQPNQAPNFNTKTFSKSPNPSTTNHPLHPNFSPLNHPVHVTMTEDFHTTSIDSGIFLSNTSTQSFPSIHHSDELEASIRKLNLRTENTESGIGDDDDVINYTQSYNQSIDNNQPLQSNQFNQQPANPTIYQTANHPINQKPDQPTNQPLNQAPTTIPQSFNLPQNSDGDTILHLAVIQNDLKQLASSIRFLSNHHLNTQNHTYLHTPLHLAAVIGSLKISRFLVLLGASTTLKDRAGDTPLHIACSQGNLPMVKKLTLPPSPQELTSITKHFPHFTQPTGNHHFTTSQAVDLCNYDGKPPLHLAYFSDHPDRYFIIEFLVTSCGADVNAVEGKCGHTLLHEMVKNGDDVGVSSLLNLPIPPSLTPLLINHHSYGNMTALDMAVCLGRQDIGEVLRAKGGVCSEYHSFEVDG